MFFLVCVAVVFCLVDFCFVFVFFPLEILSCTGGNSPKESVTETFTGFTAVSLDYSPCQNPVNWDFFPFK